MVRNILAFIGITLSITFDMARDLYCRRNYVVYDSYGPPIGNHVVTRGPKLPYIFFIYFEVVNQGCHSTCNYDRAQELKLL